MRSKKDGSALALPSLVRLPTFAVGRCLEAIRFGKLAVIDALFARCQHAAIPRRPSLEAARGACR